MRKDEVLKRSIEVLNRAVESLVIESERDESFLNGMIEHSNDMIGYLNEQLSIILDKIDNETLLRKDMLSKTFEMLIKSEKLKIVSYEEQLGKMNSINEDKNQAKQL